MSKRPSLKVCPFCGGKAYYTKAGPDYVADDASMWSAGCGHGCATSPDLDSKKDAREWWNRRYSGPMYVNSC